MNVLIAFDKFKDSMTAREACVLAASELKRMHPDWHVESAPLADGGEGFAEILTEAAHGELKTAKVLGPRLEPRTARWGLVHAKSLTHDVQKLLNVTVHGKVAVLEMAQASGLHALDAAQRDPRETTTFGTGQLIAEAANAGAQCIVLGVGGSATNDLGLGALEAVGLELYDLEQRPMRHVVPSRWPTVGRLGGEPWPHIPAIRIACDVNNPLLGPNGCTYTYGPQKGLPLDDAPRFEKVIGTMAKKLCAHTNKPRTLMMEPGAGAAGGIAFGLRAACDATLGSGFDLVSAWLHLHDRIRRADLIITGEGRFDATSLGGKGPGSIVTHGRLAQKKVLVLAGQVDLHVAAELRAEGVSIHPLTGAGVPLEQALREGPSRLAEAVRAYCADPIR